MCEIPQLIKTIRTYLPRLLVIALFAGTLTWSTPSAFANTGGVNLASLVELLISLDIIPPEKAEKARSYIANLQTPPPQSSNVAKCIPALGAPIAFGSRGEEVRVLQQQLAQDSAIYPEGEVTGYYGPATQRAVQRYQATYGVVTSGTPGTTGYGVVGPKTRKHLAKRCDGNILPPVACTMEAKLCPDGTAVGRVGPNCEFAPCPDFVICPQDMKECPNGTSVGRTGPNCEFTCSDSTVSPVACTMDAKECPDGTAVGRVGPNCEFAPCPSR